MMNKRRILGIVVVLVIGMIFFTILSSKNNISTEEKLSQIESERKPDNYIPANIKMKAKDFTVYTENKEKVNIEKYIGSLPRRTPLLAIFDIIYKPLAIKDIFILSLITGVNLSLILFLYINANIIGIDSTNILIGLVPSSVFLNSSTELA